MALTSILCQLPTPTGTISPFFFCSKYSLSRTSMKTFLSAFYLAFIPFICESGFFYPPYCLDISKGNRCLPEQRPNRCLLSALLCSQNLAWRSQKKQSQKMPIFVQAPCLQHAQLVTGIYKIWSEVSMHTRKKESWEIWASLKAKENTTVDA